MHPIFNSKIFGEYRSMIKALEESDHLQDIRALMDNFIELSDGELKRDADNARIFSTNLLENISLK